MRLSTILMIPIFTLTAWVVACAPSGKAEIKLETDKQKSSYALGQQIGNSFKQQGMDVDLDVLNASINDVLTGKKPRISDQDMRDAMMNARKAMMAKREEANKESKAAGLKFLEEHKKKPGVKVTKSGLQYEVVTAGKGKSPKNSDRVKVHYRGTLIDGTEFDSSYKRGQPAQFPVNGVIKGWTEALQMMKVGGKWKLTIPSDLAYGPRATGSIPANSVLQFDVELLEIVASKK